MSNKDDIQTQAEPYIVKSHDIHIDRRRKAETICFRISLAFCLRAMGMPMQELVRLVRPPRSIWIELWL